MKSLIAMTLTLAAVTFTMSSALADKVPVPARGSTGNQCYEDCVWHYRDFNNMIDESVAKQCAPGCGYVVHSNTEDQTCNAACTTEYNTCIANSPDPQHDRDCPIANLQCQHACFQ